MSKILVVQHDKTTAFELSLRLRARKYEVFVANDALYGISLAKLTSPDLVLLDITMPLGAVFSLAERIYDIAAVSGIPFIFLAPSRCAEYRDSTQNKFANTYFESSAEPDRLLSTVDRLLSH